MITLVLALVVMAMASGPVVRNYGQPRVLAAVAAVLSLIIFAVAVYDIADVQSLIDESETVELVDVSVGAGLWLTAVGGVIAAAGAALAFVEED